MKQRLTAFDAALSGLGRRQFSFQVPASAGLSARVFLEEFKNVTLTLHDTPRPGGIVAMHYPT
jgi:hypothetical protein